jgi:hypothetical protein
VKFTQIKVEATRFLAVGAQISRNIRDQKVCGTKDSMLPSNQADKSVILEVSTKP